MLISIIIPVYNMETTIEQAIQSVISQTYNNIEIIVLDNLSTDKTYKIAQEIDHPKLKVVRNKKNIGAYGNHNRGIDLSKGEWIKFLHGDDTLTNNCIEEFVKYIKNNEKNLGLIACGAIKHNEYDQEVCRTYIPKDSTLIEPINIEDFIETGNFIGTPSMVMLNRKALLKYGYFDVTMEPGADGDFWIGMISNYKTLILNKYLVVIRDDPNESIDCQIRIQKKFLDQVFRQILKWKNNDKKYTSYNLLKTPYKNWMIYESFKYWIASLRFIVNLRFQLMKDLIFTLYKHKILLSSLSFFVCNFKNYLRYKNFRNNKWDTILAQYLKVLH